MTLLRDEPDLRYEITAACAARPRPLRECASEFGIPFATADYRELVARKDVDAVCVFSPDHLHADHCRAALESGKHVVCTKPMVTDLEDAKDLVELVSRTGLKFLVGQTMRFDRQFLKAKELQDEGALGDIIALESHYVHDMRPVYEATPWRLQVPQDLMFGGCVHSIDVIRAFGGDCATVHAVAAPDKLTPEYPMANNFFINLAFASGAIGRVSGLYGIVHPPMPMMGFGVFGTRGSLQAEFTDNAPGEIRTVLEGREGRTSETLRFEPETDLSAYGHGATVIRYMRHFQDCLDSDSEPSPSVIDGAKSVAAGAAAWQSIQTGDAVETYAGF